MLELEEKFNFTDIIIEIIGMIGRSFPGVIAGQKTLTMSPVRSEWMKYCGAGWENKDFSLDPTGPLSGTLLSAD